VEVEGEIRGDLKCSSLLLAKGALITGQVVADRIVAWGRVDGSIAGKSITLKQGSYVEGDILHQHLMVEKGAVLKGVSRPSDMSEPGKTPGKPKEPGREIRKAHSLATNIPNSTEQSTPPLNIARHTPLSEHSQIPLVEEPAPRPKNTPAHRTNDYLHSSVLQSLSQSISRTALRFSASMSGRKISAPEYLVQPVKKPKRKRHFRFGVLSPIFNFSVIASALVLSASRAYDPAPALSYPLSKTTEAPADRELVLLAANGKPFARRGGCYNSPVTMGEVPDHFINALLAMEDQRFFSHPGIDPIGVIRAAQTNYHAGKIVQGGSTITQQLAKISYLSSEKSFERKIKEAIAVMRLEATLTKNQILERYLSRTYFGEGCFGLRAAAQYYFKREVKDLTIPESAKLIALLKSPTDLSRNPEALQRREKLVLDAMVKHGHLGADKRHQMKHARKRAQIVSSVGAYYADWIAETVKLPDDGAMGTVPVQTSFEPNMQRIAERTVKTILQRHGRNRKASQAALVVMRPDGRILAMVGGANYRESQFNRASQARRQPGSSFKAFVYLAAMRAGGRPDMQVYDEPITIGDWSPKNYNGNFQGLIPLRRAFSSSINTVAVKLTQAIGPNQVASAARDLGITTPIAPNDPSIALGTSEVTLLGLTSAYAAFAANAYPVKPWGVLSTGERKSGNGLPPIGAGRWKLMEGESMRQILEATVQAGTGRAARLPTRAYGKTGTSQNYRDAWFIGFSGNLVVGVWIGNDNNSPMNRVTGGSLPALIWKDFMSKAQRVDPKFKPNLPNIPAFRAEPRRISNKLQMAALQSVLVMPGQHYAWRSDRGDYFGNAMLFGQVPANRNQIKRRRYRSRGAWDPFEAK
jgi:penicillin-binding protein 1A